MLYYFDINTCIVTTVSGISDTVTRRATLRLQLVIVIYVNIHEKMSFFGHPGTYRGRLNTQIDLSLP